MSIFKYATLNSKDPTPLIEITRSKVVECRHRGSVVIVRSGVAVDVAGDPDVVIPLRSTAKPFQVAALLAHPSVQEYVLSDEEIAVMASSHNGEQPHVNVVRGLLRKANLDDSVLYCGIHAPYFPELLDISHDNITQIHNNCSGKHAAMVLLGTLLKVPLSRYWDVNHPVQQEVLKQIALLLDLDPQSIPLGIDGCGVPTYNLSLQRLAYLYWKLGAADTAQADDSLGIVKRAMMSAPFMVAGTNRLDTELMGYGHFIAKSGADGVYCISVPSKQLGIALKIESGSEEASEAVALEVLRRLGLLSDVAITRLATYWQPPVQNCLGQRVGEYIHVF
jgi:L-asparaginase II